MRLSVLWVATWPGCWVWSEIPHEAQRAIQARPGFVIGPFDSAQEALAALNLLVAPTTYKALIA